MSTQPTGRDHDHAREGVGLLEDLDGAPLPEEIQLAHLAMVAAAVTAERERIHKAIEALAESGVGTDLNPTRLASGVEDAWWIDYTARLDIAWRGRLRALIARSAS